MRWYAGIGARKTPSEIGTLMYLLAIKMAEDGWGLSSGGAIDGADARFFGGYKEYSRMRPYDTSHQCRIILPDAKHKFLKDPDNHGFRVIQLFSECFLREQSFKEISAFHPNWNACTGNYMGELHGRNACVIKGFDLTAPVERVIYWAEVRNGVVQGGTGTAVRLAESLGIPTMNLIEPDNVERCLRYLGITRERWLSLAGVKNATS